MTDDEIRTTIAGAARRPGLRSLLRQLGFNAPLQRVEPSAGLSFPTRSTHVASRETLDAWVLSLNGACTPRHVEAATRALRTTDPLRHHLIIFVEPRSRRLVLACDALQQSPQHAVLEPGRVRGSDVELVREMLPQPGESDTAAALRMARAFDRARVSHRFFRDVAIMRDALADGWSGVPAAAAGDRAPLALLLLSRLLFLYFLQRRGLLDGDREFIPRLFREWRAGRRHGSFYRSRLRTLFFGVLNRRPDRRTPAAASLGDLPYLNGGLFEKHPLELRHGALDLPDPLIERVIGSLLEKYRFTTSDAEEAAEGGIEPEMLGRIFEGLMPGERRSRTGTFYTPAALVDRVAGDTLAEHLSAGCGVPRTNVIRVLGGDRTGIPRTHLDAIREAARDLKLLDPACGSGAFLLGALTHLSRLESELASPPVPIQQARGRIVAEVLHGVDLLEDAALICSLRLWLSLTPDCVHVQEVRPLPNLDRRVRQGDALIDPFDITAGSAARPDHAAASALRPLARALGDVAGRYVHAGPEIRRPLRRRLDALERKVARGWLDTLTRALEREVRDLTARAADLDLFGEPARHSQAARRRLTAVRARWQDLVASRRDLNGSGNLPFFSFRVHFADAADGFNVILTNPPWVRAHNWPPAVRRILGERYRVCTDAGWPHAASLTRLPQGAGSQVDLSLLFLERAIRLLAPGGTLGILLPAKLIRSLYAGGARRLLLECMELVSLEDHSLDHRGVFDADAFTAVLIARRDVAEPSTPERAAAPVRVRMTRADGAELRFETTAGSLPLRTGDTHAPWLLAPPGCAAAFRRMQRRGRAIGEQGLAVRRGVITGANDIMLVRRVEPKLGDLARIRVERHYRAGADRRGCSGLIEASALRPVLRGTDVRAWSAKPDGHVLWTPQNEDPAAVPPPRLARFLSRHRAALRQPRHRLGTLQRLSPLTLGHKVVWADLASDLRAAAVADTSRSVLGTEVPIIPLNTVYFIPVQCARESLLLSAYLNSTPLRTFARAIAERGKDAHFRFFAWTISMLPLPPGWRDAGCADELIRLARRGHAHGCLAPAEQSDLDRAVAASYGLDAEELGAMHEFGEWLAGQTAGEAA